MEASEFPALSQPIWLTGVQVSAEDFVDVNFRLWRAQPKTRINQWVLGAATLLLAASVGVDVWQNKGLQNWSTLTLLGVAFLYGAFRVWLVRYQLRRGYAQNAAVQQPIDFELTAEGLRGQSTLGNFASGWSQIRRAVWVQPHWLLLYPSEAACYYLNLRHLQAPVSVQDLKALLTQHQIVQHTV